MDSSPCFADMQFVDVMPVDGKRQFLSEKEFSVRCGMLERLPMWLICIPLVLQWLLLAIRYRSLTLPSSANPAITAGGLVGEGKLEYFRSMGKVARRATATYCAVTTAHNPAISDILLAMNQAGLSFPVIAKPDLGRCGYGVQLLPDEISLRDYLRDFPRGETIVLQRYLPDEGEAGIFYARDPGAAQGRIIGLALRHFPRVIGDGRRNLEQLIADDPRAARLTAACRHSLPISLMAVPTAGETVRLATIGSTRVGGLYRDGGIHMTPQLSAGIDAIARDMRDFHCGRFDVRFTDLAALRRGQGFTIIEVNGAGSEAINAWDPAIGVIAGFRLIFAKQRILFAIGDAQRRRGIRPIGLLALVRLHFRQQGLIAAYPPSN